MFNFIVLLLSCSFILVSCNNTANNDNLANTEKNMQVLSSAVVDGILQDKYGKRGETFKGMPTLSIPFEIQNPPAGTKSYAVVLQDYDSIPVSGFSWIHWSMANLTKTTVLEGESSKSNDFIQGANSWSSSLIEQPLTQMESAVYGGMIPDDSPHEYTLTVYALDKKLDLKKGFYLNELYSQIDGHILAEATLKAKYNN